MASISAVIIARDEEDHIQSCLESLQGLADEALVLDTGSKDRTAVLARELGARVVDTSWQGFSETKNLGNSMASGDYILSIDADESLSDELRQSIQQVKADLHGAYAFARRTYCCGQWMKYGIWYPDQKTRLFPRQVARWEGLVHEALVFQEPMEVTLLKGDLLHHPFDTLDEYRERMLHYAGLSARQKYAAGKTAHPLMPCLSALVTFIKAYAATLGFRDGRQGLAAALVAGRANYEKYRQLRLLCAEQNRRAGD